MKSLVPISIMATLLTMVSSLAAQDDVRPLIDSDASGDTVAQPSATEDIPPPAPVADDLTIPQPRPVTPADLAPTAYTDGREVKAYDFGISYVSTPEGLEVRGVLVRSQAAAAGLKPNDMIVAVNGNSPSGEAIAQSRVESLEVVRNGVRQTLRLDADDRRTASPNRAPAATYVPRNRAAYSVPRPSNAPRSAYDGPRSTYSSPRTYRYSPSYDERYAPDYIYRSVRPYGSYPYGYGRPRVTIGYGTGGIGVYRGLGYGPGYIGRYGGYGYGRGYGRGGFSIRIGF